MTMFRTAKKKEGTEMVVTKELIDLLSQNIGVKVITEINNDLLNEDYNSTVNFDGISFHKTRIAEFDDRAIIELWDDAEEIISDSLIWEDGMSEDEFDNLVKEEMSRLEWQDVILIVAN